MPLPSAALLHIDLHLRSNPLAEKLPEHEQQKRIALTAINHVGSLGRAVSFLSTGKILAENFGQRVTNELLEELDAALYTIGEMQACLADSAYAAVDEMYTELNKLLEAKADAPQEDPESPPPDEQPRVRGLMKPPRANEAAA